MRYVPSIPPATTSPNTRQVRGLSASNAVLPVYPREQPVPIEPIAVHREAVRQVVQQQQRAEPFEDRRKTCRRVSHQPVLVELRSGFDRRRHNQRESDIVEHVDVEA